MFNSGVYGESDLDHLKELSLEELELCIRESTFHAISETVEHNEPHAPYFNSGHSTGSATGFLGSLANPLATTGGHIANRRTFSINSSGTAAFGNSQHGMGHSGGRCGKNTGPDTPVAPTERGSPTALAHAVQGMNLSGRASPCLHSSCEYARSPTPEAPLLGFPECGFSPGASLEQTPSEAIPKTHAGASAFSSPGLEGSDGRTRTSGSYLLFPVSDVEVAKREQQRWVSLLQESWFHQRRHLQQWDATWGKIGMLYKASDVASHVKLKRQKMVYLLPIININPSLLCGEIELEEQDEQISMAPGWNEPEMTLPDRDDVETPMEWSCKGKAPPVTPVYMWQSLSSMPGNAQTILENLSLKLEEQYGSLAPRKMNSQSLLNQQAKEILYWARQARKEADETGSSRVLCHYFSRGLPKSRHRKVPLANSTNASAIPELSLSKLSSELKFPLVFVADSPDADVILDTFLEALNRREEKIRGGYGVRYEAYSVGGGADGGRSAVGGRDAVRNKEKKPHGRTINSESSFSGNAKERGRYSIDNTDPFSSPSVYSGSKSLFEMDVSEDFFFIGATGVDGRLTQHSRMPSDLLTSCLTTPLMTALLWYMVERPDLRELHPILLHVMPGAQSDRKSPLGQLYHYFQCITEVIAWSRFPAALYSRLFLEDLYLRAIFQGYLLAERIMVGGLSGTLSVYPPLPATHMHHYWGGFENALERCCVALIKVVRPPPPSRLTTLEFREWLDFRVADWKYTHTITRKTLDGGISTSAHRGPVGIQDNDNRRILFTSLASMKGNIVKFPDFLKEELQALESLVDCVTCQCFDVPMACCAPGLLDKGRPHEHHRHQNEMHARGALLKGRKGSRNHKTHTQRVKSSTRKNASEEPYEETKKKRSRNQRSHSNRKHCESIASRDRSSSYERSSKDQWGNLLGDESMFWTLWRRPLPLTARWIPRFSIQGKAQYEMSSVFLVEQLPILLQSMLLAQYREKALKLLCRLIDLGKEVVVQCAEANVFPWMMRLWGRSESRCLTPTLLFIACKICYVDPSLLDEHRNDMIQRCLEVLETPIDLSGSGNCRPPIVTGTHSGSLGSTTVFSSAPQSGQSGAWQEDVLDGFASSEGQRVLASSLLAMIVLQNDKLRQECFSKGFSVVCKLLYTLATKNDVLVPAKVTSAVPVRSDLSNNVCSEFPWASTHSVPSATPLIPTGTTTSISGSGSKRTPVPVQTPGYSPLRWHLPRRTVFLGADGNAGTCDQYRDPDPTHYPETSHSIRTLQLVTLLTFFLSLVHERRQEEPLTPDSSQPRSNEFQGDRHGEEFANFALALEGLEQLSKSVVPFLRGVALHSLSMILSQTFVVEEVKLRVAQIILDALYRTMNTNGELCDSLRIEAINAGRYLVQFIVDKLQGEMDIEYIGDYISTWIVQYTVDAKRWSQCPPPLLEEDEIECTYGVGGTGAKGVRETSSGYTSTDFVGSKALAAATVAALSSTASRRGFSKTLSSSFQSPRATFFPRSLGGPLSQSVSISGGATHGVPAGTGVSARVLLPVVSNVIRLLLHQAHSSMHSIAFAAQKVLFDHLGYLQLWNGLSSGKDERISRGKLRSHSRGEGTVRLQRSARSPSPPSDGEKSQDDNESGEIGITEEANVGQGRRNNWGQLSNRRLRRRFSSLNLARNASQVLQSPSSEISLKLIDVYPCIPLLLNRYLKCIRSTAKTKQHIQKHQKEHYSCSSFSLGGRSPPRRRGRGHGKNMATVSFPGEKIAAEGNGPLSQKSNDSHHEYHRSKGHKTSRFKHSSGSSYSVEEERKPYHRRRRHYSSASSSSVSARKSSSNDSKGGSSQDGAASSVDGQEAEDTIPIFVYGCLKFFDFLLLLDDDGYDPRTAYNRSRESASDQYVARINKGLGDVHRRYGNGESSYLSPPAAHFKSSSFQAPPTASRVREEREKLRRQSPPMSSRNVGSYAASPGAVLVKGVQLMSMETISSVSTSAMPPQGGSAFVGDMEVVVDKSQQEGFNSPDPPPLPSCRTFAGLETVAEEGHPLLENLLVVGNETEISGGCGNVIGSAEQSSKVTGRANTTITGTTPTTTASVSVLSGADGDSGGSGRGAGEGGTGRVSVAATVAPPTWRPYQRITTSLTCPDVVTAPCRNDDGKGHSTVDEEIKRHSPPSRRSRHHRHQFQSSIGTEDSGEKHPNHSCQSFVYNSYSNINAMVFHPSEPHLVSCTSSGVIQVWEYDINGMKDAQPRLLELSNFHVNVDDELSYSVLKGLRRKRRGKNHLVSDPLYRTSSPPLPSSSQSSSMSSSSSFIKDDITMQSSSVLTQNTQSLFGPSSSSSFFAGLNLVSGLHIIDVTYQPLLCVVRSNGTVSLFSSYASHSDRCLISTFNTLPSDEYHWIPSSGQNSANYSDFYNPVPNASGQQGGGTALHQVPATQACVSDYCPYLSLLYVSTPDQGVSAWDLRSQYLHTPGIGSAALTSSARTIRVHPTMPMVVGVVSEMVRVYDIRQDSASCATSFGLPHSGLEGMGGVSFSAYKMATGNLPLSLQFSQRYDHLVIGGYGGASAPVVMWDDRRGDIPLHIFPTLSAHIWRPALKVEMQPLCKALLAVTATSNALHWTTGPPVWTSGGGTGTTGVRCSHHVPLTHPPSVVGVSGPTSPSSPFVPSFPQLSHQNEGNTGFVVSSSTNSCTEEFAHEISNIVFHPFQELLAVGCGAGIGSDQPQKNGCKGSQPCDGGVVMLYGRSGQRK